MLDFKVKQSRQSSGTCSGDLALWTGDSAASIPAVPGCPASPLSPLDLVLLEDRSFLGVLVADSRISWGSLGQSLQVNLERLGPNRGGPLSPPKPGSPVSPRKPYPTEKCLNFYTYKYKINTRVRILL